MSPLFGIKILHHQLQMLLVRREQIKLLGIGFVIIGQSFLKNGENQITI
jgi:hypothetical protein